MSNIADQVKTLETEHDELSAKVTALEALNAELKAQIARLVAQFGTGLAEQEA